jgi:sialic acid synthase SpsE/sugar phosphate isomerase/epimerase
MYKVTPLNSSHIINSDAGFDEIANRLDALDVKCVFVVDSEFNLIGSITDGDVRRGLLTPEVNRASQTASAVCNTECTRLQAISFEEKSLIDLPSLHYIIPLLNGPKLVGFAVRIDENHFKGRLDRIISEVGVYIIAEIGNNHNGSLSRAKTLVDLSIDAGANAVKFQMRNSSSLYREGSNDTLVEDLGVEYTRDLLQRMELSVDEHLELYRYVKNNPGIDYICTPWDEVSVGVLQDFGVDTFKIASADLTNDSLINSVIDCERHIILSTGMSTEQEIQHAVRLLQRRNASFTLLHTSSAYPAPYSDLNLRYLDRLKGIHHSVGYSGHERGFYPTLAAVAMGAKVVERHITLSRDMEGPDHSASLEGADFKEMVRAIRIVSESLGRDGERRLSQGELINRESLGKSIVAACPIGAGELFTLDKLQIRSPGQGLSPQKLNNILGRMARRDIEKGGFLYEEDLSGDLHISSDLQFARPWGIPVRFHDVQDLSRKFAPKLVEYHLSYKDIERAQSLKYDAHATPASFTVHAPEIFEDSHLLDLCSPDATYRSKSVISMKRVLRLAAYLADLHGVAGKVKVITNVGGFSRDDFLSESEKSLRSNLLEASLNELVDNRTEIVPQTMAPFPWHFGGQRYQNLFLHPSDINELCDRYKLEICLDISHAALYCNEFGCDINDYIKSVAKHVCHLHISDADGSNGEGLQINEGSLDFSKICRTINLHLPRIPFIPEVWQGHKAGGNGFSTALRRLQGYFSAHP